MNKINEVDMFNGLMHLVATQDGAFTKTDYQMGGVKYRIFNYRIPSWTQMQLPYAKEARGVMFNITEETPHLVCLTPQKFFNYSEGNPKAHEGFKLGVKMVKIDGSLISSFEHNGKLFFKSKNSIESEQVVAALKLLYADKQLVTEATEFQKAGWTMNYEYVAPDNTVVIVYDKPQLFLLSARNMETGQLIYADKLEKVLKEKGFNKMLETMVPYTTLTEEEQNQKKLINGIGAESVGEGYVIEVLAPEPYLVKVKNDGYTTLHQFHEKENSDVHLIKVVLQEKADDARSLFRDRPDIIERLENVESIVLPIYNKMLKNIEDFYEKHKSLDMKSYVMKAQSEDDLDEKKASNEKEFNIPLAQFKVQRMKDIFNLKNFCLKNPGKVFGIKDKPKVEDVMQEDTNPKPKM